MKYNVWFTLEERYYCTVEAPNAKAAEQIVEDADDPVADLDASYEEGHLHVVPFLTKEVGS